MKPLIGDLSEPVSEAIKATKPHFMRSLAFSAMVNILYLAPTLYMMQVYDRVVPTGGVATLIFLTLILAAAIGTLTMLDSLRTRLMSRASLQLNANLASEVLKRILSGRSSTAANRDAPLALRDLDVLRQTMTGPGMIALFDAPWMPIYLIAAFLLHPLLALLILVGAGIQTVLAVLNERSMREGNRASNKALAQAHAASEALSVQAENIRALGMREALTARHSSERSNAIVEAVRTQLAGSRYTSLVKFVRMFLQSLALGAGALLAVEGKISAGSIIAASVLLSRALQPIEQFVTALPALSAARNALKSLNTLFGDMPLEEPRKLQLPEPTGLLQLNDVSLKKPDTPAFIVRGIELELRPGEMTGLIGPTGAGKSTIAKIAAGAIRPDFGSVRIDKASVDDWDQDQLARFIGYLPQNYTLISGTITENISRFAVASGYDPEEVDAKVIRAAKLAGVHEMILQRAGGYNGVIGGRDSGLSGGQTQRIALARALYGDPKMLIFDEPSASLDAEGETALMRAVEAAKEWGASVLMVAHRSFVLSNANWLVVVNGGVIERQGPRDEVITSLRAAAEEQQRNVVAMKRT